jgi:hypothetical protein
MNAQADETPLMSEEEMDYISRTGRAIYQEKLKAILEPEHNGEMVAIHIDTGDYEVGPRKTHPSFALRDRHPEGGKILITDVGIPRPDDTLTQRMMAAKYMEDHRK